MRKPKFKEMSTFTHLKKCLKISIAKKKQYGHVRGENVRFKEDEIKEVTLLIERPTTVSIGLGDRRIDTTLKLLNLSEVEELYKWLMSIRGHEREKLK